HGQPREENYRDWMPRQAFPDTLRRPLMGYRPCGQTVVSENAQILHQDVSLRAVRPLAVPCLALQKAVQIFLAAIEAVGQVLAAQLLDRAVVHSRTLGVLRSFSRRGRDFDGASSAATKASYCLALSGNSRRSASVSAAAASPLSRMKALTVLRSTDAARRNIDFALGVRRTSRRSSRRFVELRLMNTVSLQPG